MERIWFELNPPPQSSKGGMRLICWVISQVHFFLEWKCHFGYIFIIGCTGGCQIDNFQCSQCWKFHEIYNSYDFVGGHTITTVTVKQL